MRPAWLILVLLGLECSNAAEYQPKSETPLLSAWSRAVVQTLSATVASEQLAPDEFGYDRIPSDHVRNFMATEFESDIFRESTVAAGLVFKINHTDGWKVAFGAYELIFADQKTKNAAARVLADSGREHLKTLKLAWFEYHVGESSILVTFEDDIVYRAWRSDE